MNVNTVNPYLPHGVEYARQSQLPKSLQVQDTYKGTNQGQAHWRQNLAQSQIVGNQGQGFDDHGCGNNWGQDGTYTDGPYGQTGPNGQNLDPATAAHLREEQTGYNPSNDPLVMSQSGSILNKTRGMNMGGRDYPIILDGEVIIADGTVKPDYSNFGFT